MVFSRKIETEKAPKAVGPYSQAVEASVQGERVLFVSGQLPILPSTGVLQQSTIQEATRQVFDNIEAILQKAQCGFKDVVRVEVFMKDLNDFPAMNEEYKRRFAECETLPARQTIQVAKLPMDALVEISCIAICR